jgi:hypothetical protein
MAIVAGDIKFYLSGGSANANPALSLGGDMSSVEVTPSTLFDTTSSGEALSGRTDYRCVYVKNTHATLSLTTAKLFINAESSGSATHELALSTEAIGVMEDQTIASEITVPTVSGSFTNPVNYTTGILIGDILAGSYKALWFRRTIPAASGAVSATVTFRVQGDSAP